MPIPLEGKKALIKWDSYKETRPTRDIISQWFDQFPNARIGLITGNVSNLLVLDSDGQEGGEQLKDKEIPDTWTVKTPRAGYHYYFSFPQILKGVPTTLVGLLPKVDVRGQAGYVVSVNGHKDYSWVKSPYDYDLADPPQWLIDMLLTRSKPTGKPLQDTNHWLSDLLEGVDKGSRHEALIKLASYYFSRMPSDVAIKHIQDWNLKNSPPISEEELNLQLSDLEDRFTKGTYISNFIEEETDNDEELLSADEIMKTIPEPKWILEPYIPESGLVLLCGEAERGKTWLALDLAIELTRGGKWLGQFETKKSKVMYIDEEKPKAFFKKRLRLLGTYKNYLPLKDMLQFSFQKGMKLDRERGVKLFLTLLERHNPNVVILDAFADFLTGKENDVTDILKIYDILKTARKKYNTTFIIIDHEKQAAMDRAGKVIINEAYVGNDVRGSKAKRNVVDTQLSFKMVDGQLKVFHSKTSWAIRQKPFIVSIDDVVKDQSAVVQFRGYV
jgi:archaellum biogenesis ATPase FlaH